MADEYTPTTEQVQQVWASRYDGEHSIAAGDERRGYEAEFDRWLAEHDAETREQIAREIDDRASQAESEDYSGGPAYTSGVRYGLTIAAAIAGGAS